MSIEAFFAFARERHQVYLHRQAGHPRPWTDDPILQHCRFTNVYRELDKTTVWFRQTVRDALRSSPEVLLATVLFRWFNRIETGEAIFCQKSLNGKTAFENFLDDQDLGRLRDAITAYCGSGPYVTGAFIINTPTGMSKLDGVLWAFDQFAKNSDWRRVSSELRWANTTTGVEHNWRMETVWNWLRQFPRLGDFMSYEVVCDLRYTDLLCRAPDIMTWANPGPGAKRGLSYIYGGNRYEVPEFVRSRENQIKLIQELLHQSRDEHYWPQGYPPWEMREVEHTLCEYAKYEMVKRGEGRTKGVYK